MSCSLSQKRTEDLLTDYPKLVKQVLNQKFFWATGTRPFKIHETNISAAALLITMAHRPLPLHWLNILSPSAIPFRSLKLHQILDGTHNNHLMKLHCNLMVGWGSCGCHHVVLPMVTFFYLLCMSFYICIIA